MTRKLSCLLGLVVGSWCPAHGNTFVAEFSGGGTYRTPSGGEVIFDYPGSDQPIDVDRVTSGFEFGVLGGHHVRAFGFAEDDGTFSFINSAASVGRGSSFAETTLGLDFTNTEDTQQRLQLTSTVLPGALGIFFSNPCTDSDIETVDIYECAEVDTNTTLSQFGRSASVSLAIDVFADDALIDSFDFGLSVLPNGTDMAPPTLNDNLDPARGEFANFRRLNQAEPITDSVIYAWDESTINFFAGQLDPGETTSLRIVFRSSAVTDDQFDNCKPMCLTSFMGFGDPIGGGTDEGDETLFSFDSFQSSFSTDFSVQAELVSPVPVPAGFWLMGVGLAALGLRKRQSAHTLR